MPTRTSPNATPSQSRQLSEPRTNSATRSCSPRASSLGAKMGGGTSNNYRSSTNTAYQTIDLVHYHVPKGSLIIVATVRLSESNSYLDPIALHHRLLGGEVVRLMISGADLKFLDIGLPSNGEDSYPTSTVSNPVRQTRAT